jgi:16S rRNA (guanine1516-N2)-methyltransferase
MNDLWVQTKTNAAHAMKKRMKSRTADQSAAPGNRAAAAEDRPEPSIGFSSGSMGYRYWKGQSRAHPLVRALGKSISKLPNIIDATAGLGRDAFILASVGCHVTMIERNPKIFAMLAEAVAAEKAKDNGLAAVLDRMTLLHGDAKALLPSLSADIIVIDPMHPERKSSALTKIDLRLLREVVGGNADASLLVQIALTCKCEKVILKWPAQADALEGLPKPNHSIIGRTTRYDVFVKGQPV